MYVMYVEPGTKENSDQQNISQFNYRRLNDNIQAQVIKVIEEVGEERDKMWPVQVTVTLRWDIIPSFIYQSTLPLQRCSIQVGNHNQFPSPFLDSQGKYPNDTERIIIIMEQIGKS